MTGRKSLTELISMNIAVMWLISPSYDPMSLGAPTQPRQTNKGLKSICHNNIKCLIAAE